MTQNDPIEQFRFRIPEHERRHPWLSLLLDCYARIDYSVQQAISESNKKLACHKGCNSLCCCHTIPLSTFEVLGITFYTKTILDKKIHELLINKITKKNKMCLFNVDNCCTIYPLRSIACRRYIIASQCCTANEDPLATRRNDVLEPSREYLYRAIEVTLPFYLSQNIHPHAGEHIFNFYKRQNVVLSSVYDKILLK